MLVIGGGFTGSEVASVCRELGLPVTLAERGPTPLSGALGQTAGTVFAKWQRHYGVDLRCNVTVMALEGDKDGRCYCLFQYIQVNISDTFKNS